MNPLSTEDFTEPGFGLFIRAKSGGSAKLFLLKWKREGGGGSSPRGSF